METDRPDAIFKGAVMLDENEHALAGERTACRFEGVRLDLADVVARRALFPRLRAEGRRTLVIAEGLLVYLEPEHVASFATDLAASQRHDLWLIDLASPGLIKMMKKSWGRNVLDEGFRLERALARGASFREIAAMSGRAPSSISREVGRHGGRARYLAVVADTESWQAARPRVARDDPSLALPPGARRSEEGVGAGAALTQRRNIEWDENVDVHHLLRCGASAGPSARGVSRAVPTPHHSPSTGGSTGGNCDRRVRGKP